MLFRLEQLEIENEVLKMKVSTTRDESKVHKRENEELKKEIKLKKKFMFSI